MADNKTGNEKAKETFIKAFSLIKREGAAELLEWIKKSDFFTAPASTKYHGANEGGLLRHSVQVYILFRRLYKDYLKRKFGMDLTAELEEQIALLSLTHDLCKCNFYEKKQSYKGEEYYAINDKLPIGHGEKSLYIVMQFIKVTDEEALAIRWHMGAFDEAVKGGSYSYSAAQNMCPVVALLHCADILASQVYGE